MYDQSGGCVTERGISDESVCWLWRVTKCGEEIHRADSGIEGFKCETKKEEHEWK
jgi:hypothetical protein